MKNELIVLPHDASWNQARLAWNLSADQRPAAVALPESAKDVQAVVRAAMRKIWTHAPEGISGNDDLGQMSSWYVWSALGLYPVYPGRARGPGPVSSATPAVLA